jgi:hypothetical protein
MAHARAADFYCHTRVSGVSQVLNEASEASKHSTPTTLMGETTMNTRTYSLTIPAPKSRVFAFLADIENLPEWATGFCQRLEVIDGRHWAVTPQGKTACEIRSHQATGTIDFLAGPTHDEMTRYPARALDLPEGECLYQFTTLQLSGMSDEEFEAQESSVRAEFDNILRIFAPVPA